MDEKLKAKVEKMMEEGNILQWAEDLIMTNLL